MIAFCNHWRAHSDHPFEIQCRGCRRLPVAETIVADKGYDSEKIRELVEQQGAKAVIPRKRNSVKGNAELDRGFYRNRHLVENAFARLKHYRAVASRLIEQQGNTDRGCYLVII